MRNTPRKGRALFLASAHATAMLVAQQALAGIGFNSGASSVKFSHDADKSDADPTAKTFTLTSVPSQGSIPTAPSFQFNKPIATGASDSDATGSIGYRANSVAASFELGAGTGVAQDDEGNVWGGASSLKLTVDLLYNVTSGGWGATATAQAALAIGAQVGAGGYVQVVPNLRWYEGTGTSTPISGTWNTGKTWNNNGAAPMVIADTLSFNSGFFDPSYSNGDVIHLFGTLEFRSSNQHNRSEIRPLLMEFSGGAQTGTFLSRPGGTRSYSDAINWLDGNVAGLDPEKLQRAKLVNINLNPFGAPGTPQRNVLSIDQNVTLFGLDLDGAAGFDFVPVTGPGGTRRITFRGAEGPNSNGVMGNPVLNVKRLHGDQNHSFNVPIQLLHPLDLNVESRFGITNGIGVSPAVNFMGQLFGDGSVRKMGVGSARLGAINEFLGGVEVHDGFLHADATHSLGSGAVTVFGGVLNYNVTNAAGSAQPVVVMKDGQLSLGPAFTVNGQDSFTMMEGSILEGSAAQINALRGDRLLLPAAGNVVLAVREDPSGNNQLNFETKNFLLGIRGNPVEAGLTATIGSGAAATYKGVGSTRGNFVAAGALTIAGNADAYVPKDGRLQLNSQIIGANTTFNLNKRGAGTLILQSNSGNYTGTVNVQEGTLFVNGTVRRNLNVSAGATLGGNGQIGLVSAGVVNIKTGGIIAPGTSVGTLTVNRLTLDPASILEFELRTGAAGDLISVTANGGLVLPTTGEPAVIDFDDPLFDPAVGNYPLIDYVGTFTGTLGQHLVLGEAPTEDYNFQLVNNATLTRIELAVTAADGPQWDVNGGGLWTEAGNWIGDVPDGYGDEANFLQKLVNNSPASIQLDGSKTVGVLEFNADVNLAGDDYVIVQTNPTDEIVLDNGLSPAAIDVAAGSHRIEAPLVLVSNTQLEVAAGANLTITTPISIPAGRTLTKMFDGTATLSTVNLSDTASLAVNGGQLNVAEVSGPVVGAAGVSVQQGTLQANRLMNVAVNLSLNGTARIAQNGTSSGTSVIRDINVAINPATMAIDGQLDLADNRLIVKGDAAGADALFQKVRSYVASGFAGGDWNGEGINSSAAAADPDGITGLGVRRNVKSSTRLTEPLFTELDGHALTTDDTLVIHTYYGDSDFNGLVDGDDYKRADNGYLNRLGGWENGDSNHDGITDLADYILMDAAFFGQTTPFGAGGGAAAAAPVPEPGSLGLLAAGGMLLRRRRRR